MAITLVLASCVIAMWRQVEELAGLPIMVGPA